MAWPALLYTPIGLPGQRPVGLLIAGARTAHWYRQHEIDWRYVFTVIAVIVALVLFARLVRVLGTGSPALNGRQPPMPS